GNLRLCLALGKLHEIGALVKSVGKRLTAALEHVEHFRDQPVAALGRHLVQPDQHEVVTRNSRHRMVLSLNSCMARSKLDLDPLRSGTNLVPVFLQPVFTRRQASWLIQSMGQKTHSTEGSTVSMRDTASRRPPSWWI